ncbi:MAG: SusC/RagA family TonB-linked outer membrane protein [Bacteroidetes bacterium]|jgi:TonB-linked SusC/RagA family outer membrane protein|nr:MAG: SusC/RagA family TonB-linked outer membrane protein [Bacteroidota bacterium]
MRKIASLCTVLMLLSALVFGQQSVTVTGQVKDDKGESIPFATILETGTRNATKADASGMFSIKIKSGSKLTITATGFNESTVSPAANGTMESFSLTTKTGELAEVVVTTAMGVKKQKKEVGYSTTTVGAKELTAGKATNIGSALQGKAAGLMVQSPNSSVTNDVRVTLRGNRSISGNNQPILVVDGTILGIGYLNQLEPNDVDNVTILKGASATAIYGNEATNGAIIVTTKKGSRNNPIINFTSTVNVESISLMPKLQNEFGSYGGEGLDALGHSSYIPYENQSYGPRYDGSMVPLGNPVRIFRPDGSFYDTALMIPYKALADEKKNFFDKAFTYQNDVSFSSGDATGQIFVSAGNMRRNGTTPGDKAQRNSLRFNASKDIHKVSIGFNVNYVQSTFDVVGPDVNQDRSVYWTVLNTPAHVPLTKLSDTQNNPYATPSGYFNAYYGNPWWTIHNSRQKDIRDNLIGNLRLEVKPLSWLSASYNISYSALFDKFQYHRNSIHYDSWAKDYADNGFDIYPASGGYKSSNYPGVTQQGYRENFTNSRLQGDALIDMHKTFSKFNTRLLLGHSVYEVRTTQKDVGYDPNTGSINSYDDISVWGPSYAIGTPLSYNAETKRRAMGVFGDLNVNYAGYLNIHGSLRNDWDSRLEKDNRSFLYPAGDIAFLFTDAIPGLKSFRPLTSGKLRVAYSKVGQINVNPYSTRDVFVSPAGFPYSNSAGSISSYIASGTFNNLNIKPEFTTEKEIGLELAWFRNRLLVDVAVFQQNTINQTLALSISSAAGRSTAILNIGEVQNRGFEADVKGTIVQTREITWRAGVNYSYIKNEVLSIDPGTKSQQLSGGGFGGGGVYAIVGQSYPYLQTTDWIRVSGNATLADGSANPNYSSDAAQWGRIVVDGQGLPQRDPNVKGYGTTQPPHRLGINTSVSWKNFTFSAVAEYRGGGVVLNAVGADLDFTGVSENTTRFNREKFVIPNSAYKDGTGKFVQNQDRVTNTDSWNFFGNLYNSVGSNYVTSADFWKIREVAIGYDFPVNLVRKTKIIKAANLSLVGRDLFIFTVQENIWTDPEFSNTTGNGIGITTNGQTPSTRKYGISLNLTF